MMRPQSVRARCFDRFTKWLLTSVIAQILTSSFLHLCLSLRRDDPLVIIEFAQPHVTTTAWSACDLCHDFPLQRSNPFCIQRRRCPAWQRASPVAAPRFTGSQVVRFNFHPHNTPMATPVLDFVMEARCSEFAGESPAGRLAGDRNVRRRHGLADRLGGLGLEAQGSPEHSRIGQGAGGTVLPDVTTRYLRLHPVEDWPRGRKGHEPQGFNWGQGPTYCPRP